MDKKLQLLLNASYEVGRQTSLKDILVKLTDVTRNLLEADRCSIFLHDKNTKTLWTIVADGVREIRIPDNKGIAGHVFQTGEQLNIRDAYSDARFDRTIDTKTGYKTHSILTYPLKNQSSKILGVFQVMNKKETNLFEKEDMELLRHLSLYVATNVENMQLHQQVRRAKQDAIYRLSHVTKFKDPETQSHIIRVGLYGAEMARSLNWKSYDVENVQLAMPMHDIGKVGIPDKILQKPGKLDDEEWVMMRRHSQFGFDILKDGDSCLMQCAAITALDHHERWDGNGYPNNKKGEEISIYGRFAAISDVFDALTSERCYKKAWSYSDALDLLHEERERHFDPELTDIFLSQSDVMIEIKQTCAD